MEDKNQKDYLSFADLLGILRAGLLWIVIITLICLAVGVGYAFGVQKTSYTAQVSAHIFAESYKNEVDDKEIAFSETTAYQYSALLVPQCKPVFTSNEVLKAVKESGINLNGSINFITEEGSPYFSITYTVAKRGGNPDEIKAEIAKTLNDYVDKSIEVIDADKKSYAYLSNKITVYSKAYASDVKSSTGRVTPILLSLVIGLVLSVIFVLLKHFLDDTVSSKEQVESMTGTQIIALIDISTNTPNPSEKSAIKEVK